MCGIAGIVKLDPREAVDEARLKRMRDVLRHRGPDGEGLWIEGPVGLAHRRLAIMDVAGGAQPMTDEQGTAWVVCNGEIYNHPEVRRELEARGHRYRTGSDTETIVHLYEEDGARCVDRLRGMFAFALWDRARAQLLLVRDRLGIKPLYYEVAEDEILFASEIKAILAARPCRPAFNDDVLPEFLATRYVSGDSTFFRGINKLLPGRVLTWSAREGLGQRRYWALPSPASGPVPDLAEAASGVARQLRAAVERHLMSDVPLGVFLSGGLDSTALAAIMAPLVAPPLRTFAVGFDDPRVNELGWARLAARAVGAEHHEAVVTPQAFFDALPDLVWHEDEPIAFTSSVPLYFVARLAAKHVKVVLTGEGSDELFAGYNRYRLALWNARLGRSWSRLPARVRAAAARTLHVLPGGLARHARRTFVAHPPGARGLLYESSAVFGEALQRRLLADPGRVDRHDPHAAALALWRDPSDVTVDQMTRADLETYLHELLMKQDQMSMAASIESRVPFLDDTLVEHVVRLPAELKLRALRTKAVLREAVRDAVPSPILTRRKMGFPVPVGQWLGGEFSPLVDEVVLGPRALGRGFFVPSAVRRLAAEHRAGTAHHGEALWLLLGLELWHRIFIDGDDRASILAPLAREGRRCA